MTRWKKAKVTPDATLRATIEVIDNSSLQVAIVVDEQDRLLGIVTDGDVRRALLKLGDLNCPVSEVMNQNPKVCTPKCSREDILDIMRKYSCHQVPIIDGDGHMVDVVLMDDLVSVGKFSNSVVLMAGGLGSRLGELTKDTPKPLLKVGGKPIMESIIGNLSNHGFENLYISVNYHADKIKEHFGDGKDFGVRIKYLQEDKKLGTAGPLSLIEEELNEPLVVMNGDLLTDINLQQMLTFHEANDAMATMAVRKVQFQIPYGVVQLEQQAIQSIDEKPSQDFFVNAGIYVFSPEVLKWVPHNEYFDMNILFNKLMEESSLCQAFPIREYWLDIGRKDDFHSANKDYDKIFGIKKGQRSSLESES